MVEFETEDEAKSYQPESGRKADVTHIGNKFVTGYSEVGEMMSKAIAEAAVYYGMRIPFDGDYQIGNNWKECH